MSMATLYLYWEEASPQSFRWQLFNNGAITHSGTSSLEQLLDKHAGLRTTLLVPTEDLLITSVSIPTSNKQKLRQAVPYALEEQLIDDVDDLHYAISAADSDGMRRVAIVKRDKMAEWLQPFDHSGLRLMACLPDIFILPKKVDGWTLLIENHRALLRTANDAGYALPLEGLAELISTELSLHDQHGQAEGSAPQIIDLIDCRSDADQFATDQFDCSVERISCSEGLESLTTPELNKLPSLNLLQGEFSHSDELWRHLKPWRAAAALLLATMLLSMSGWVIEYQRLVDQDQALQANIEKIYRQTFPGARKIINPRLQMEQKLAQLNRGQGGAGFSQLMVSALPILLKVDGIKVEILRYKQQSLEMELTLKDLPSIDKLKELMEAAGFQFNVKNASSSAGRVTGRVAISRGAS